MADLEPSKQQQLQGIVNEWKARLTALEGFINTLEKNYILNTTGNNREATIKPLLSRTKAFGQQIFTFFVNGTSPGNIIRNYPTPTNPVERKIAVASIPTLVLDQIGKDLSAFWDAFLQRIVAALPATRDPSPLINQDPSPLINQALTLADHLAWSAKTMLSTHVDGEKETTVLSLLQARAQVRLVPYAPVAVIGVPMMAVGYFDPARNDNAQLAKEFLGIPHEFAHYVYWYGRDHDSGKLLRELLDNTLKASLSAPEQETAIIMSWIEEIFADVVGCLIGGPVVALSLQDMLAAGAIEDFYTDYGTHPVNALRPFILTQTLRQRGMNALADDLQKRWKAKLSVVQQNVLESMAPWGEVDMSGDDPLEWRFPIFKQDQPEPSVFLHLAFFAPIIKAIVDDLVKVSTSTDNPTTPTANPTWSSGQANDITKLYEEFNNYLTTQYTAGGQLKPLPPHIFNTPLTETPPPFGTIAEQILSADTQSGLQQKVQNTSQETWQHIFDKRAQTTNDPTVQVDIPGEVWRELLAFGGWATEIDRSPRVTG